MGVVRNKLADVFSGLDQGQQGANFGNPRAMLSPEAREHIPAPILNKLTEALSSSIAYTFMWALVPAVLAIAFVFLMGKERLGTQMGEQPKAKQPKASV